jgi:hypothetical protein
MHGHVFGPDTREAQFRPSLSPNPHSPSRPFSPPSAPSLSPLPPPRSLVDSGRLRRLLASPTSRPDTGSSSSSLDWMVWNRPSARCLTTNPSSLGFRLAGAAFGYLQRGSSTMPCVGRQRQPDARRASSSGTPAVDPSARVRSCGWTSPTPRRAIDWEVAGALQLMGSEVNLLVTS